jgi:hypothetical protein
MSDSHKPAPEFGSEVQRLETPEHRRQRRRNGIATSIFGIAMGVLMMVVGVQAMRTGEMVYGPKSLPITGGQACVLAAFLIVVSGWLLWRALKGRS